MNVARSSGLRAFARSSKTAGAARCAFRPSSSSFAKGFPPPPAWSKTKTCFSFGHFGWAATSLAAWSGVEAKATVAPQSRTMYSTWSVTIVGKTGTRTPP